MHDGDRNAVGADGTHSKALACTDEVAWVQLTRHHVVCCVVSQREDGMHALTDMDEGKQLLLGGGRFCIILDLRMCIATYAAFIQLKSHAFNTNFVHSTTFKLPSEVLVLSRFAHSP